MSDKDICVCGWPRSGNTLAARLLGEALNSPVTGWEAAVPLATEGLDRIGEYTIRQIHLRPIEGSIKNPFIQSAVEANRFGWQGEKAVYVKRDPRDVAVSAKHYWELDSIKTTITAMAYGDNPFRPFHAWSEFNLAWLDEIRLGFFPVYIVSFESLVKDRAFALFTLLHDMGLADYFTKEIKTAYEAQSFENKRKEIEAEKDCKRPYGQTIQLKHMRKGIVGDWKNEFSAEDKTLAKYHFEDTARKMGYWHDW